jgi:hypothetical protein
MEAALTPWWVASAVGIVTALGGVIGKLWSAQREEVRGLRAELAAANARIVELQTTASARIVEQQKHDHEEHVRDLRRMAGIAASWPPPIITRR